MDKGDESELKKRNLKSMTNCVYILANKTNVAIYVGVTSDLPKRVYEHKTHADPKSYTARYDITKLVYYEVTGDIVSAIEREKQLKSWSRSRKNELIESVNPEWKDLYESILE